MIWEFSAPSLFSSIVFKIRIDMEGVIMFEIKDRDCKTHKHTLDISLSICRRKLYIVIDIHYRVSIWASFCIFQN